MAQHHYSTKKPEVMLCPKRDAPKEVKFSTSLDLICGVEMRSKNHQIAWTLADYFESLEKQFANEFPNKAEAEEKPEDEQQSSTREPDESSEDEPDKRKVLGLKEYKR